MAQLPLGQATDITFARWKAILDPVIKAAASPLAQGMMIQNVVLGAGATAIPLTLGRVPTGWFLTDINGAATVYRSMPFSISALTLTSSAAVTASLVVF